MHENRRENPASNVYDKPVSSFSGLMRLADSAPTHQRQPHAFSRAFRLRSIRLSPHCA